MARRKRKASAAQLRNLAKGRAKLAARRKAKTSRPAVKRRRHAVRKSRPVVKRVARRTRRATLSITTNPFLGELAMIGNPKRRKSHRKSHRRSHRRSSRSMILRNPMASAGAILSAPKQMVSKDFLTEAASVAVGFVLPNVIMAKLPSTLRDAAWKSYATKVATVAVLSGASSMVSKRVSRAILIGGGVSILLDLYADFVAPMIAGVASPSKVSAFYGNPEDPGGMGAFYGNPGDPGAGLGDGAGIGEAFA